MPLPYLGLKEGGMSAPVEPIVRKPDQKDGFDILDSIAEDLLKGLSQHNLTLVKAALSSLCTHIQTLDMEQDNAIDA